jgi:branched-chain amino acid transport system substrate-binding protein
MELLFSRRSGNSALNRFIAISIFSASLITAVACTGQQAGKPTAGPYFDARQHQTGYSGPSGPTTSAEDVDEVRIGYFGPADPEHPLHGSMWRAAQLAIEQANREGGLAGKPFRLLPAWSEDPWGTGIKQLAERVYGDRVWAIVGGVDGPSAHLAEQIVAKARLPLVSAVSTDKSVNLANVPWMFSLAPGDHLIAAVLSTEIARVRENGRLLLLSTDDHDALHLTRELRKKLTEVGIVPDYQFQYRPQTNRIESLVAESRRLKPTDIIVIANARHSADLVASIRNHGYAGRIFGGPAFGQEYFLQQVREFHGEIFFPLIAASEEVVAPYDSDEFDAEPPVEIGAIKSRRTKPYASQFDFTARLMYDAVQLTVNAIRTAGLNRVEICNAIRQASPWDGTAGRVRWDGLGSNTRSPLLGTLANGVVTIYDRKPDTNGD